ncbi:DUF4430 domain-containing protein [Novipirellula sp. SH528]|uniref:DUF4430 domain-containing protein n=1 Tax=Novipirellula sp. SH528 TaxID=3454466 RepID=UPI003FA15DEC
MNNISKLQSTSSPRFHASLLLIAIFAIGLLALMPGCRQSAPDTLDVAAGNNPDQVANSVDGETIDVTVVIQANDSSREFKRTDIQSGATVEEVMRTIDEIPVTITGSGVTAFVSEIDGVSTTSTEGWKYKIDGVHAEQGIGSTELDSPATITWAFGSYEGE